MAKTLKAPREMLKVSEPLLPSTTRVQQRIEAIWESGFVTNGGQFHNQLESGLKEHLDVEHLALFNNGTIALLSAIMALELPSGSEVITTPLTFPATVHAIMIAGLKPVFADVRADDLTLCHEMVGRAITEQTSAIVPVHVYGNPCDVHEFEALARKHDLKLVYDAAHCFGTKVDDVPIGEFGNATMFSFHATKLFTTIEGGAVVCRDGDLCESIARFRNFGIARPYTCDGLGLNGKMNEIQAAIGLDCLDLVAGEKEKRRQLRLRYDEQVASLPGVRRPLPRLNSTASEQYYAIVIDPAIIAMDRNTLQEKLFEAGIQSRAYFSPLCSDVPIYSKLDFYRNEEGCVAEDVISRVLCLPYHSGVEMRHVEMIRSIINGQ